MFPAHVLGYSQGSGTAVPRVSTRLFHHFPQRDAWLKEMAFRGEFLGEPSHPVGEERSTRRQYVENPIRHKTALAHAVPMIVEDDFGAGIVARECHVIDLLAPNPFRRGHPFPHLAIQVERKVFLPCGTHDRPQYTAGIRHKQVASPQGIVEGVGVKPTHVGALQQRLDSR